MSVVTAPPLRIPAIALGVPAPGLPTALVIGPQKTGTTWIHRYLELRGDVGSPRRVKETFFFDRRWTRGPAWYARQFRSDPRSRGVVEVGPTYFHAEAAPFRVRATLGRIPVACLLRDPVERTVSLWLHFRRYGMTRLGFREAVEQIPELLVSGCYGRHLERWFEAFGPDRVLTLFHHDLARDPQIVVDRLCHHFGLEPEPVPGSLLGRRENGAAVPASGAVAWLGQQTADALRSVGAHAIIECAKSAGLKRAFFGTPGARALPEASAEDRERVREALRPEIERTEAVLGVDLAGWKRPPEPEAADRAGGSIAAASG